MREPSTLEYVLLIFFSLLFAVAGLYVLTQFSRMFKQSIKNELLRKNVVAWLAILCISNAMVPMSGGFFICWLNGDGYGRWWAS